MKKLLLVLALFFVGIISAQEKDSTALDRIFLSEIKPETKLFSNINSECNLVDESKRTSTLLRPDAFLIEDYILCSNNEKVSYFFKVFDGEQSYYVNTNDCVVVSENEDNGTAMVYLSAKNKAEKLTYKNNLVSLLEKLKNRNKADKDLEEAKADDLILQEGSKVYKNAIILNKFSFPAEYTFVGFSFSVFNNSKNKIKYVTANVSGYNDVDDKVYTISGQASKSLKGIGPIEPQDIAGWTFETIWDGNSFSYGVINSITVEYFNGTKKTYTNIDALILPDDYFEASERLDKYLKENPVD